MTTFSVPLVGSHFRPPAKSILACLPANAQLEVRQEPENPYDSTAVAVWVKGSAVPESMHPELEALAQGQGFALADILAGEWHLGYCAAKPPKGYTGTLAKEIFEALEGAQSKARLSFLVDGKPAVIVEVLS